jgi:hypothetical protein
MVVGETGEIAQSVGALRRSRAIRVNCVRPYPRLDRSIPMCLHHQHRGWMATPSARWRYPVFHDVRANLEPTDVGMMQALVSVGDVSSSMSGFLAG